MSKRKPTPMPTEAVHPLEPRCGQTHHEPRWVDYIGMLGLLAMMLVVMVVALILVAVL